MIKIIFTCCIKINHIRLRGTHEPDVPFALFGAHEIRLVRTPDKDKHERRSVITNRFLRDKLGYTNDKVLGVSLNVKSKISLMEFFVLFLFWVPRSIVLSTLVCD
jgi:hypothetical protein